MSLSFDFETELHASNLHYRIHQQAELWKLHRAAKFSAKKGYAFYTNEKLPADYHGYLPSGRAILIEAKSTESNVWTVRFAGKYTTVPVHQLGALKIASDRNVLAGMLVRFGIVSPRVFALTVPILWPLLGLDKASDIWALHRDIHRPALKIKVEDMPERCRVEAFPGGGWAFLSVLQTLENGG